MKKRSLVAAVAMLIVSAVLLTSATYAWFAGGAIASVQKATATVEGGAGNVQVSHNATTGWDNEVTLAELGLTNATSLTPIDVVPGQDGDHFTVYGCSYDGTSFAASESTLDGNALVYTWYVRSVDVKDTTKKIGVTVAFDPGTSSNYVYGAVCVDNEAPMIYSALNDSYNPFGGASLTATENATVRNGIVNTGDNSDTIDGSLGSTVSASANATNLKLDLTAAGAYHTIKCVVWAEGQDASCFGTNSCSGAGFTFSQIKLVDA
jgi:hypothetical protein